MTTYKALDHMDLIERLETLDLCYWGHYKSFYINGASVYYDVIAVDHEESVIRFSLYDEYDYPVDVFVIHKKDEKRYDLTVDDNFVELNIYEVKDMKEINENVFATFKERVDTILFGKLYDDVKIPSKREEDAGYDIYPYFKEDFMVIWPHQTRMIPTGLVSAFPSDYVAILKERGSTGTKGIGQRCGVIDSGYRGEWMIPITNHNNSPIVIKKEHVEEKDYCSVLTGNEGLTTKHIVYSYEKAISQCIMVEVPKLIIEERSVEEIKAIQSERGEGKLGSSCK